MTIIIIFATSHSNTYYLMHLIKLDALITNKFHHNKNIFI